jgi:hypothetical protein
MPPKARPPSQPGTDDGLPMRWRVIADRQAITRSDGHQVLGIFTDGYQRHQYDAWLLTTVANVLRVLHE